MTSQSPLDDEATPAYRDAWLAMGHAILEQGRSWSGREKNCAFLNTRAPRFANVSAVSGIEYQDDARALARVDWDQDGHLDLIVKNRTAPRLRFLRNRGAAGDPEAQHWFALRLEGVRCNRDAIGAKVFLEAGGRKLRRTLYAAEGYLAQSSRELHFGLGDATRVDRVRVVWPGGEEQEFEGLDADTRWSLRQGDAPVERARTSTARFDDADAQVVVSREDGRSRTVLHDQLPLGPMPLPRLDGEASTLADHGGQPVLVNLWSSTCGNCVKELGEWKREKLKLAAAGLKIVALTTDPAERRARARELITSFGFAGDAGELDEKQLALIQVLLAEVLGRADATAIPMSLLFDAQGDLCVIYQGPVELETLLRDVAAIKRASPQDRHNHGLLGGRTTIQSGRDFRRMAQQVGGAGFDALARHFAALGQADARGVGFQR